MLSRWDEEFIHLETAPSAVMSVPMAIFSPQASELTVKQLLPSGRVWLKEMVLSWARVAAALHSASLSVSGARP